MAQDNIERDMNYRLAQRHGIRGSVPTTLGIVSSYLHASGAAGDNILAHATLAGVQAICYTVSFLYMLPTAQYISRAIKGLDP